MKLNVDKFKTLMISKGQNGLVIDNTKVPIKRRIEPIPLTQEQQQNFKLYGSLNKPEVKQTYLSQGRKLTPAEQQASNKKLKEQWNLQAYYKRKEKEAKDLEKAIEVAPYVIPGLGQAMWAGMAVDLATNKMSDGKYKSWGSMIDDKTGSGEFIGDLTNPGYMIGGVSQVLKKPISRLTNIPRRNLAISEYITPFGYEGKGKEVKKFLTDYVIKGKDKPDISWMTTRSQYDPVRAELRGEAWRKYLNVSKESDKLYIKNSDGTFRYNPEVIPKENIEFQRQAFSKAGNGNSSKEYLTEQLQSAEKGFVGNAGGVTSIIDDAGNFTIKDTWDLMPLQRFKWLPKKIQNIEVGKVVGAKPFTVLDDQIGRLTQSKKQGGVIKAQEGGFFNKIVKSKEYNSPLATALKIVDPTGISSYGDVYNAWADGKFDYNDIIEPLGAIPVFGKLGKAGKFLLKGIKGIEDFNNAKKIIKSSKFVNSDVIKAGGRTFKTSFNKTFVSPYTFQEYQSAKKFIKGNPLLNYSQYGIRTIAGFDDIMDVKNQGKDFLTSVQNKSAKKQEGGLLERKGVPFTAPKPIQPEFPYNGQSMYKGGYNLKRALELYKPDKTGHLPSVDSETGEWLKDKDYPTSWKELLQSSLNLNLNKQVGFPILNTNGRLQYINKNNK